MALRVSEMTADELKNLIGETVEEKLIELFGDPDEGLAMTKTLKNRLMKQKESVAKGERGELFDDVLERLGLT